MGRGRDGFAVGLMGRARSWRRLASGSALTVLAAVLVSPPLAAAAPPVAQPLAAPAEQSVPVTGVSGRSVPAPESDRLPRASAGSPAWPAGGTASIAVDTGSLGAARSALPAKVGGAGAGRAGGLAVRVRKQGLDPSDAQADPKAEARLQDVQGPASVRVSVADRSVTDRAGVHGVLFTLVRDDGTTGRGKVALDVDYSGFANAYGGGYGSRLRLVRLPGCVLTKPQQPECRVQTPVDGAVNTVESQVVSFDAADVADGGGAVFAATGGTDAVAPVGGTEGSTPASSSAATEGATSTAGSSPLAVATDGQTVYALAASGSGSGGDYTHTSLAETYGWAGGSQGGELSYHVPLKVPPALGGPVPDVTLQYSSASVDGRTISKNNQASWVGEGWDYAPGYIEQSYRSCKDDEWTNNDLCWFSDRVMTMVFGGRSGRLVKDDTSGAWHLESDDGSRLELLQDNSKGNGDWLGRYWKLTAQDGTQYFFGMNKRYAGDTQSTNSAQNVLVYSNHAGEPCKNYTHDWWSGCDMTYRWNLDYVVDPRGNTMTYFYTKYQSKYGNWNGTDTHVYDVTATLDHIDYGTRAGSEAGSNAPMQVVFGAGTRCLTEPCYQHPENWLDTPWDQYCGLDSTSCTQTAPTFWTPYMLSTVTTRVWSPSTSSYQNADVWTLQYAFPPSNETNVSPSLWLDFLYHTGYDGANSLDMPRMHFGGDQFPNLVANAGPYYKHFRLSYIDTGTGKTTLATYSSPECTTSNINGVAWDQFPLRCYPQWNGVGWNYYQKYVVTKVTDVDTITSSPNVETSYDYSTAGSSTSTLWHYGTDESAIDGHRSWTDFAGYATVTTTRGAAGGPQTVTKTLYYRGLNGDRTGSGTRQATVTDSVNGAVTDSEGLRGTMREEQTVDGSTVLTKTIHQPWLSTTGTRTASWPWGTVHAQYIREAQTDTGAWLAASSSWRWGRATYTYNSYGLNATSKNYGDLATTADDSCSSYTYAPPDTTKWLIGYPVQALTTNCAASPTGTDYLSGTQTFYDNLGFGVTPTKGLVTKSMKLRSVSGTTLDWVQDSRTGYDPVYGRVTDTYDALDRHSTVAYTPADSAVNQTTTTNPLGHTTTTIYNPLRGNATIVADPNGLTTTAQYDPLGRLTKVFKPHTVAATYSTATATQTFTDIISTGTAVPLTGDNAETQISLPFTFSFYGQNYTSAWLSTNGLMSFTGQAADATSQPLPSANAPNAAIYPFWDDLQLDSGSAVATKLTGTAPNRQFTIEWYAALLAGRSTHVTFTVTLNENGVIVFDYSNINARPDDQGNAATIGLENAAGTAATQYAYHQTLLANDKAITFTPSATAPITAPDIEYVYTLRSSGGPNAVTTKVLGPTGNQITSYELYNGFLQLRQTQTPSLSAQNGRVIADTQYDNRGLAAKHATFWNSATPADTIAGFTDTDIDIRSVTVYDNLERPIRAEQWSKATKLWQTQTQYDGDRTAVIPPDGGATASTVDVFGNTTALDRYPTSSPTGASERTSYTYDPLGQLTRVTDAAGNQTTYTYDLLGRLVSTTAPDTGASSSVYDDAGQLTSMTDARGQKISHEYDQLGRETVRWAGEIGTGTELATFTYDSLAKGLPTASTRWVGADPYTVSVDGYTDQYQPTGQTWTVPMIQGALAGSYHIGYTYDLVGNLATISYPAGGGINAETVTHSYTSLGAPRTTIGSSSYVTSTTYGGLGQLTQRVQGSTTGTSYLSRTYTYDPATMHLTGVKSEMPDQATPSQLTTIANDAYAYTPTGDITRITDLIDNQSQCYRYDPQHRLSDAWTAVDACAANPSTGAIAGSGKYPYWDNYAYDTAGRRWSDTHRDATSAYTRVVSYPAAGSRPIHAASSVAYTGAIARTDTMTYDNAGNTKQRTINGVVTDFTFNTENQFASATVHATGGDQQTTHLYDATGSLLIRKDPTGTTLYAAGQEFKAVGSTVTATRYYTHGGHTVAVRNPSGNYRLATDNQGSATLTVNTDTAAVQRRWYTPYGDDRASQGTWPTDRGFLNKQTNTSTGLIDVGAREYDPVLGTFISVDPITHVGDPQQINGYSYAANNPVTLSDPSGLSTCRGDEDCDGDPCYGNPACHSGAAPPPPPKSKPKHATTKEDRNRPAAVDPTIDFYSTDVNGDGNYDVGDPYTFWMNVLGGSPAAPHPLHDGEVVLVGGEGTLAGRALQVCATMEVACSMNFIDSLMTLCDCHTETYHQRVIKGEVPLAPGGPAEAADGEEAAARAAAENDWEAPSAAEVDKSWQGKFRSRNDFGEAAWGGHTLANATSLETEEQLKLMRGIGLTWEEARLWRNFYRNIADQSAAKWAERGKPGNANPSAASRAELFQWYMDNL